MYGHAQRPAQAYYFGEASSAAVLIADADASVSHTAALQLTGTWSGTVVVEATNAEYDEVPTWVAVLVTDVTAGTTAASRTATGMVTFETPALRYRVRVSAYSSGTVTARLVMRG